jgi:hypothetical protein
MAVCTDCKEEKPVDDFYLKPDGKPISYCKPCSNARCVKYEREHPERRLRRSAIELGLNPDEIIDHYAKHNGLCDICNCPPTERDHRGASMRRLCIDHDHATGKFRGLLCSKCNLSIAYMNDNPKWLRAAAEYLEEIN